MLLTGVGGLRFCSCGRGPSFPYRIALVFGLGCLLRALQRSPLFGEPVSTKISVPLAIVLLALIACKVNCPTLACLVALGLVSVASDSLEASLGFCLLAAVLVLWQRRPNQRGKGLNKLSVLTLVMVTLFALCSMERALVEGYLGKDQQLSVQQIENSGSLLVGGRPGVGRNDPAYAGTSMGFRARHPPSSQDVLAAKAGVMEQWDRHRGGSYMSTITCLGGIPAALNCCGSLGNVLELLASPPESSLMVALIYSLIDRLSTKGSNLVWCTLFCRFP